MDEWWFRVLGPVQVFRSGMPVEVEGRTSLTVLTGLLASPNRVVPVSRLVEWVWGETLPSHPQAALQSGVARLRRILGSVVETRSAGYMARVGASELDLLRFAELRGVAARAIATGDVWEAIAALDNAVSLWQEPVLCNVESAGLRALIVPQLTEQYLAVVEERAGLYIQTGRADLVTGDLSAVVGAHPYAERIVGQWMTALANSGRRADAVAAYAGSRRLLRDELGVEPCADLQALLVRILRDDSSRASQRASRSPCGEASASGSGLTAMTQGARLAPASYAGAMALPSHSAGGSNPR